MAAWRHGYRLGAQFWRELPLGATALFLGGVFCLFGSIGFIFPQPSLAAALVNVAYGGGISATFAFLGTRAYTRWLIVMIVPLAFGPTLINSFLPQAVPATSTHAYSWEAVAIIVLGYVLMLLFIGTEGRRYGKLHAEVDLAGQIHRALAPALEGRVGEFEYAGASQPSGMVGGDLLDVMSGEAGWLLYVADVSGHGVAAGVLTGLVKSGARTWLAARSAGDGLLPGINRVLTGILPAESFVTFGALACNGSGELRLALAGHLPLLHFHAATGEVTQQEVENFPLGLFRDAEFASAPVTAAPGDVLALYTDGLTEIFTPAGESGPEFGIEGLSQALRAAATKPLAEVLSAVQAAARAFGAQSDDQTLLLVRRLG